jgi:hypothetical protein
LPTAAKIVPSPGTVRWPSLPLIVTVTVPSEFGSTTKGPASTVVRILPFAGFVYVMWKSTAWVTSLPLEKTVSRSVPSLCTTNGNGHAPGPAGSVNVRSMRVIVVAGWSAAATGTNTASTASAAPAASATAFVLILIPPVRYVHPDNADVLRQVLRRSTPLIS